MDLVYKNEKPLKILSIVISVAAWAAALWFSKGLILTYVLLFALIYLFAQSGLISYLRGSGVRVSADQYPEIDRALAEACQRIDFDPVPECYVLRTNTFNALATRFLGHNFIVLFADVLDALRDRPEALNFYIGHELGHLARRHLQWQPFLLPASILPLLGAGYSRAKEYTCDRYGLACSPGIEAAQRGLLAIATSGSHLSATNVDAYIAQTQMTRRFWMSFHELVGDYPWLTKRVAEVTALSAGVPPEHPRRNFFAWLLALIVPRVGLGAVGGGLSLMVTVAIIGILAAIAIPAYQEYTIRAQVNEGIAQAGPYQAAVIAAGASSREDLLKLDNKAVGMRESVQSRYVEGITVEAGAVVIHFGGAALTQIAHQQLVLLPALRGDGSIAWICGRAEPPPGSTPVVKSYARYTSVAERYLPVRCHAGVPTP